MSKSDNSQNISISDSSKVSIGNIENRVIGGDSIDMSGDFRGANVNIKSKLTNASQMVSDSSSIEPSTKEQIQDLLQKLNSELQQVPSEKENEADAVASLAGDLVSKASEEKPNPMMMKITGEGLKQAAQSIADIVPVALEIATKIVTLVTALV